jgi:hypothetical protein
MRLSVLRRSRPRLGCEQLEDRVVPSTRTVLPVGVTPDNINTFTTLGAALTTPGLRAGDVIQIEPGSAPGAVSGSQLPPVANLTVQGEPAVGAADVPAFTLSDGLTVTAPQAGFTLRNVSVDLQGGGLTFQANGTVDRSVVRGDFAGDPITLDGTTAALISNSTVVANNAGAVAAITVQGAAGGHNLILGNTVVGTFAGAGGNNLLFYSAAGPAADRILNNTFTAAAGFSGRSLVLVGAANGLTLSGNRFQSPDGGQTALSVTGSDQNITVSDNDFALTGAGAVGVEVFAGPAGTTTGVTLAGNRVDTQRGGTAVRFATNAGALNALVTGNDLRPNKTGVRIDPSSAADAAGGIDLGGGALGSAGGNNFRGFTAPATAGSGAVVEGAALTTAQTVSARFNLFSVPDPETVIFDNADVGGAADVVATGNLTGNAAFVQALFLHYLHRVGDVANPAGAGAWVAALNAGAAPASVANGIARSPEALGRVVDGIYRLVLARDSDPTGRAAAVTFLQRGGTAEALTAGMFGSPEYAVRFGSDAAFAQSLYPSLLGRAGSPAEISNVTAALPGTGRAGMAAVFLASAEYRGRVIRDLYTHMLNRAAPPSAAEVAAGVNSGIDLLTLEAAFAASPEFQQNG